MSSVAVAKKTLAAILDSYPHKRGHVAAVMQRLAAIVSLPKGAVCLDVGAAAGAGVLALQELGFTARGVEPVAEARENAARLAEHFGTTLEIAAGTAEALPFPDETFHVVLANSVLEHVINLEQSLREAYRVLKPGGVFWFSSTSVLCPRQHEIHGFPLFAWYPLALKRRLMDWAKRHRPGLIGHTDYPAIHWFTPWKARRLLREAGFTQVYDRWDLRRRTAGAGWRRWIYAIVAANIATKCLADVFVEGSAYAAIKP